MAVIQAWAASLEDSVDVRTGLAQEDGVPRW